MTLKWTRTDYHGSIQYTTPLPEPFAHEYQIATQVVRWYNREERSWVTAYGDEMGNQVGSSQYDGNRDDAEASAEHYIAMAAKTISERAEMRGETTMATETTTTPKLTPKSAELFSFLWNDKDNWSGTPPTDGNVDMTKEERGNLTQLKRAGLITTSKADGMTWVQFTDAGLAYGETLPERDANYNLIPAQSAAPESIVEAAKQVLASDSFAADVAAMAEVAATLDAKPLSWNARRCQHYHVSGKGKGKRCSQPIAESGWYYCKPHACDEPCKGCGDVLATKTTQTIRVTSYITVDLVNYQRSYGELGIDDVTDWVKNLVEGTLAYDPALRENGATVVVTASPVK